MRRAIFSGLRWIFCNLLCLAALLSFTGPAFSENVGTNVPEGCAGIEISFTYQRGTTIASNQLAVWVEDTEGTAVRTLLVTDFTAGRRGYRNRDMSLPAWVKAADPESMADPEIDALSGATPAPGRLVYVWDLTDDAGRVVPPGVYTLHVEGTLYWESDVVYTAMIDTTHPSEEIAVHIERTSPEDHENEELITQVSVSVIPN